MTWNIDFKFKQYFHQKTKTNSQVIPSLKIKPLWKRVVDWPKLLAYLIKWPKCTCVYVADACLRCQAENKQEDCVGKEINCSTPEVLNQNAVNCRWRPVSVTSVRINKTVSKNSSRLQYLHLKWCKGPMSCIDLVFLLGKSQFIKFLCTKKVSILSYYLA